MSVCLSVFRQLQFLLIAKQRATEESTKQYSSLHLYVRIIIEFLSQSFILNLNDFNKVSMISIGQTSNFHGAWNQPCHHDQESCTEAILMLNSAWLPTSGLSHCAYCASNSIYYALLQLECMAWYKGEQSFAWNAVISRIGLE